MAKPRGRPFQRGRSGNPKGRPKGIKEVLPRNSLRAAWNAVTDRNPTMLEDVIERGLQGERHARVALPFLELGARLNKEIGPVSHEHAGVPGKPILVTWEGDGDA